jgi:hypothetical protein
MSTEPTSKKEIAIVLFLLLLLGLSIAGVILAANSERRHNGDVNVMVMPDGKLFFY